MNEGVFFSSGNELNDEGRIVWRLHFVKPDGIESKIEQQRVLRYAYGQREKLDDGESDSPESGVSRHDLFY
jgi:hypothetical protein